eukprot:6184292-Pleurochrysis_carterae.AAC.4
MLALASAQLRNSYAFQSPGRQNHVIHNFTTSIFQNYVTSLRSFLIVQSRDGASTCREVDHPSCGTCGQRHPEKIPNDSHKK